MKVDVCLELELKVKAQIDELARKADISTDQYMINIFIKTVRQAQSSELTDDDKSEVDKSFFSL